MKERIQDRRSARTRRAILSVFVTLVIERRYDSITVGDIVGKADVGRSTFYEHFRSKDDLLRHSMEWVLAMIADAVSPDCDTEKLAFAVAHLWDNRRLGRIVFAPPIAATVRRSLERLIGQRLEGDCNMAHARAVQIAGAQLALLEAWSRGDLVAGQEQIAERLRATGRL
jgi:AcrR family transcriptional regulator